MTFRTAEDSKQANISAMGGELGLFTMLLATELRVTTELRVNSAIATEVRVKSAIAIQALP
jgi:hypothetical protein